MIKNDRPILKIKLTKFDYLLESISLLVYLGTIIYIIYYYNKLPNIIPIHFDFSGKADAFGNKSQIISIPIINTILYIGLTVLNKYPHIFNYLGEITLDNAASQYKFATRLLRFIKLIVMIVFLVIVISVIHY